MITYNRFLHYRCTRCGISVTGRDKIIQCACTMYDTEKDKTPMPFYWQTLLDTPDEYGCWVCKEQVRIALDEILCLCTKIPNRPDALYPRYWLSKETRDEIEKSVREFSQRAGWDLENGALLAFLKNTIKSYIQNGYLPKFIVLDDKGNPK